MILRPCLGCGCLIPKRFSRCATCSTPVYNSAHQRRSRLARAMQPYCSECGTTEDLTGDHIVALANGGDMLGPLDVLCRSCNSRRGANPHGYRNGGRGGEVRLRNEESLTPPCLPQLVRIRKEV